MRIDVKKFLFFGIEKDRKNFFEKAQKTGIIEFINKDVQLYVPEEPSDIQELRAAIKVLRGLPVVEQEEIDNLSLANSTASCIVKLNYSFEALHEEKRILQQEINRVEVFGDFSLEDLEVIQKEAGRKLQFFFAKKEAEVEARSFPEVIYVGSMHGLDYYTALNRERKSYEGMIEIMIERPLGQLYKRLNLVNREILAVESELKIFSKRNDLLHQALVDKLNLYNLNTVKDYVQQVMGDSLFAIEGWVAQCDVESMQRLLEEEGIHGEEICIEEGDCVPTHLKNQGLGRIGEDLVDIYDTPAVSDKDPSSWVLGGFILFFAMIIGDGGYGLLFLMLSLFLWMKCSNLEGIKRRVLKLFTMLSLSCIVWGVLSNSFFGIRFSPDSFFRKFSVIQWIVEKKAAYHMQQGDETYHYWLAKYPSLAQEREALDFINGAVEEFDGKISYEILEKFSGNILLELALFVGVIHITISFFRGLRSSWAGVGWILCMLGGYLHFPSILNAVSMVHFVLGVDAVWGAKVGLDLIYLGIGLAVVLALVQHRLMGTIEIMNLIQVFADVLSYLRLYALALAGSMMSSTFNGIAESMPIVLGVCVIVIGHFINIVLSVIGGVIHGLRLHFIEWYHYSFEGGGKMHKPLKLLKIK